MELEEVRNDTEDSTGFSLSQEGDSSCSCSVDVSENPQEDAVQLKENLGATGPSDFCFGESAPDTSTDKHAEGSVNSPSDTGPQEHMEVQESVPSSVDSASEAQVNSRSEKMDTEAGQEGAEAEASKGENPKTAVDPYHYINRQEFTSEIYKIEMYNLPKNFGFKDLRKRLVNQLQLKPHKVKSLPYNKAFITFKNEADCEKALAVIPGHEWKGQLINAKRARPAADPQMKRKAETDGDSASKKVKLDPEDNTPPEIRLKNTVTPLWNVPYEDQLKEKTGSITSVLKSLGNMPEVRDILAPQRKQFKGLCCELQPIEACPDTEGYRNKCEFTISKSADGKDNTVGFRFGLYKDGCMVGSALDIAFLPDSMKQVLKAFQLYLDSSQYRSYDPVTHQGHWRQLAVRTTQLGHIMIIPMLHLQNLSEEAIAAEKARLVHFFSEGSGKNCGVTSLYFQGVPPRDGAGFGGEVNAECAHQWGDTHIYESLLDLKFRISPNAFFQVNTRMAAVLYSKVAEWLELTPETIILDICCGTGTIGLSMAKMVKKVIGIELCKEAIEDAKANADINGITNAEFHCDRAENVVVEVMKSLRASHVVAVVDPPRAGLHKTVLKALRNCRLLRTLIYVSCNPNSAKGNFVDLIRPSTKKMKGLPYQPVRAIPVDLFPHTPHCELVMLLERDTLVHSSD